MIDINDFQKIDLRIGKVKEAEKVSDKLLKIKVDIGSETRHIVAGIGEAYSPEELINKNIVIVVNLKPKTIRGIVSEGMLLAAVESDKKPILLTTEKDVQPGSKVS